MGWAYQVYIMAALCLEGEHHFSQSFPANNATFTELAYGVILAEDAAQVTVGKKDSA